MRAGICLITLAALMFQITGCGGGNDRDDDTSDRPKNTTTYRPALSLSPYKDVLVGCATIDKASEACRLSRLPFIGQATHSPTKADIMTRVVVSHPWMATRFSQLLDEMPDDIYQLFGSVTAVVIGSDIRPSYYWAATGAIYLDPADLWLTATERNTISREPDYRSDFAQELNFSVLSRYVQGANPAWDYYSLDGDVSSRPLSAIVKPMAALLFHELAHANDFIPPGLMHQVKSTNRPVEQASDFLNQHPAVDLSNRMPLVSNMMYALAKVMYQGERATNAQKALNAATVGLDFANDGATHPYAYSSIYEDTAMLFEEVMMKYHFNVDKETAFTDSPPPNAYCDAYVVRWGARNRIGDPLVQARAVSATQQLLDRNDVSVYFAGLPAPRPMVNGKDWCANLAEFEAASPASNRQKTQRQHLRPDDLKPYWHQGHQHLMPF